MRHASQSAAPLTVDPTWRIGIVAASFYKEEMDLLVGGATQALIAAGIPEANISVHRVFGSFEVPLIGAALAEAKTVDALLGFGIIVEGETHHARLLADQAARGIMDVQLRYRLPFSFEILYVKSLEQARERCRPPYHKGEEAAHAALHSLHEIKRIRG